MHKDSHDSPGVAATLPLSHSYYTVFPRLRPTFIIRTSGLDQLQRFLVYVSLNTNVSRTRIKLLYKNKLER